jgi:multisubunit Na+/H+ antiporter MnhE subunit
LAAWSIKIVPLWLAEFFVLLGMWLLFVSNLHMSDLLVGVAAAAIATTADEVVKSQHFVRFRPRLALLFMVFWEPWYVLTGTASIWWAIARKLAGRKSEALFKVIAFEAGGDDSESAARRALAVVLTTIPPNFVVVGIDRDGQQMLIHQVSPTSTPLVTRKLGAKE